MKNIEDMREKIRDWIERDGSSALLALVSEELFEIAALTRSNRGPDCVARLYERQAAAVETASKDRP